MPRPPLDTAVTQVSEWSGGQLRRASDCIVAEEPLEIRAGSLPLTVTMRTPGHDEELAAGLLFTEGIVNSRSQIAAMRAAQGNVLEVELASVTLDRERLQRNFYAASSCGICGKASIDAIRVRGIRPPDAALQVPAAKLCEMPAKLRNAQAVFGRTGGVHAAALFDAGGALLALREDVGRHNAVDKIAGWALLNARLPLSESVLLVSGRGGFEIVQKALLCGTPVVACVSAPSSLAVQLAREFNLTLIGFLRGERFVVYSAERRILP